MLSKREKLFAAVSDLHGLICPVCRRLLSRQGDNLICAGGHAINVNRRGCVNLLSAQADTFYDAALFAARERVFAAGRYQPVADAIDALLPDAPQKLLDAGCGEGWYLNALLTRRTDSIGAGIDISRDAILQATNQPCQAVWCVGICAACLCGRHVFRRAGCADPRELRRVPPRIIPGRHAGEGLSGAGLFAGDSRGAGHVRLRGRAGGCVPAGEGTAGKGGAGA